MYATINLPGSSHFEYYGPASKAECETWLESRTEKLSRTEQITSLLPQRIVTNRDAESWRYLDGNKVVHPQLSEADLESAFGPPSLPCGCDATGHSRSCPGYGLE